MDGPSTRDGTYFYNGTIIIYSFMDILWYAYVLFSFRNIYTVVVIWVVNTLVTENGIHINIDERTDIVFLISTNNGVFLSWYLDTIGLSIESQPPIF